MSSVKGEMLKCVQIHLLHGQIDSAGIRHPTKNYSGAAGQVVSHVNYADAMGKTQENLMLKRQVI